MEKNIYKSVKRYPLTYHHFRSIITSVFWGRNGFDGNAEHLGAGSGAEPLKNP